MDILYNTFEVCVCVLIHSSMVRQQSNIRGQTSQRGAEKQPRAEPRGIRSLCDICCSARGQTFACSWPSPTGRKDIAETWSSSTLRWSGRSFTFISMTLRSPETAQTLWHLPKFCLVCACGPVKTGPVSGPEPGRCPPLLYLMQSHRLVQNDRQS